MDFDDDASAHLSSPEPPAKRRRLRKGTTSCWGCKKRKVKCKFDATSDTVCVACRRRGATCVSQERPEEELDAQIYNEGNGNPLLGRIQRVENLLGRLVAAGDHVERNVASSSRTSQTLLSHLSPSSDYYSHTSLHVSPQPFPTVDELVPSPDPGQLEDSNGIGPREAPTAGTLKLSEDLVAAFPPQEDIDVFCKSNYIATFYCYQIFTDGGDRPEHEAFDFVNTIARVPDPRTTPPILIAKRMIIFALFLQYFQTRQTHGLTEHPSTLTDRLLNTAMHAISTHEDFITSRNCIEGLECLILEGVFQFNGGNLRRAWLSFRKAMVFAQLMRIDLPNPPHVQILDPLTKAIPKYVWFRIVYMDSYLSLMLGLPHGGQETNLEDEQPAKLPTCKLKQAHTLVARRVLDRNRRSCANDFTETRSIDRELLAVASDLPEQYWTTPDFPNLQQNTREALWETMRLSDHLHHYNLVHLLHLPYLLSSQSDEDHTYAKITCVSASREILRRVIAFRNFCRNRISVYCRTADFCALMAGMTILLAHIDSHRLEAEDWRAHQRLSDRALVEQLLQTLETVGIHTNDRLTHQSAEHLRRLLKIESDTARNKSSSARDTVNTLEQDCRELRLSIPYFGIINIGGNGITRNRQTEPSLPVVSGVLHAAETPDRDFTAVGSSDTLPPVSNLPSTSAQPTSSNSISHDFDHSQLYPGLAAGVDDWAFQGVDAAFFNSLMLGTTDWNPVPDGNL
ncbi:hypothetical protein K491DRAFT_654167 [Lophiostoma macrostomum CBS 122681]|uniref:Zn(2)-C6 fungal-type domain-containing protein n=1 Tax=Lophiostoma macrostomum CBS 122681 TaxID=1314788 RepID=A0A6A6TCV2_9PLEO|nr:hypothetical protein K491DRAFT_654167 [Lophiostoma macrostomum CBS 122681]